MVYKSIWTGLLVMLGGFGVASAVLALPPIVTVMIAIVGAVLGRALNAWMVTDPSRRRHLRSMITAAFASVSLCGGAATLGSLPAIIIAVVLTATAPRTVQWLAERFPPREATVPPRDKACVDELSDAELCLAWRRSYVTMNNCTTPARKGSVAAERQSILDELERRHPAEFTCWLYADASPAKDPGHYLDCAE